MVGRKEIVAAETIIYINRYRQYNKIRPYINYSKSMSDSTDLLFFTTELINTFGIPYKYSQASR